MEKINQQYCIGKFATLGRPIQYSDALCPYTDRYGRQNPTPQQLKHFANAIKTKARLIAINKLREPTNKPKFVNKTTTEGDFT